MKSEENEYIEKLYETYYMDIYSYILTIVKNKHLAEELAQETFFKAMKSEFKGQSSERTWLSAIAKNLCMDEFRARKRETLVNEEDYEKNYEKDNIRAIDVDVENTVLLKMQSLEIHMALHELDEPYREVFSLRVFGELSFRDIGKIFGKTENWARVTYHRGKLKLQDQIKQDRNS